MTGLRIIVVADGTAVATAAGETVTVTDQLACAAGNRVWVTPLVAAMIGRAQEGRAPAVSAC